MPDQRSFSDAEQDAKRKKTRREVFLEEMDQVVPWAALEAVIEPFYPRAVRSLMRPRSCISATCWKSTRLPSASSPP